MVKNYESFKQKLLDTRSHSYKQLRHFVTKPVRNMALSSMIADELSNQTPSVDKITYNDVFCDIQSFRPKDIEIRVRVYLRPGETYKMTKNRFKRALVNDADITKDGMFKFIKNSLIKQEFHLKHGPAIKQKFIRQVIRGYKSQEKVDAVYAYLMEYLRIRMMIVVDDEEIKEFVAKQQKFMNNELKKVHTKGDRLTVDTVVEDGHLKKILGRVSNFADVFTSNKVVDVLQFAYVLVKPTPINIAKFIVLNRHFGVSKKIIHFINKEANSRSDFGDIDVNKWDNNRLMASVSRVIDENPDVSKTEIVNDTEFSHEFLLSNFNSSIKEITTTDKGNTVLVKSA